jgi:hypothetical protein
MSYPVGDFQSKIVLVAGIHPAYTSRAAELNAIATALNPDTITHDTTIKATPATLRPGHPANSRFTNDILHVVNRGRAGNLTPLAMSNAITAELSKVLAPVMTTAPFVTGTATVGSTLSCTQGNWTYVPTAYAYQWLRGGATIAGATAATRVLQAADSGTNISCRVTATNPAGSTPATSNAIAIA